jgi:L-malate glycosyltransferase
LMKSSILASRAGNGAIARTGQIGDAVAAGDGPAVSPYPARESNVTTPVPILFAHNGLDWITGSERCLLDLVSHLDRSRFRPVVVCNGEALATASAELGATVYWGKRYGEPPSQFLPNRALVREARRIIHEQNIRLIHANDFQPVKWLMPAARAARIPMVLHVHVPTTQEERCYTWSHQVARVVGVGRAALEGFLEDGLPLKRTAIIYNAVDPERLSPGDPTARRADLRVAQADVVLTVVGSLIRRKGVDVLIRALAQVRVARPASRVRLLVVGDGDQREELEALATSLGLADVVHFLGRRSDVAAILRDATDVALSAAREEALPLNVLEAGFFGLPMVVSDIPPHREIVQHGQTGLIVPADNPAAFATAIVDLLENRASRQRLGETARRHIHSGFLIERYVREFSQLYEGLLERPARTYGPFGGWAWPQVYNQWIRRSWHRRVSTFVERAVGYTR